jgi:DNA polymerase-3 subunit gamma/tau
MAYTVLARKYRSQNFDEVVGQDQVAQTLKRAIESGRIAHAFLFTGTRGTGKTSMARILAKALNCEKSDKPTTKPCGKCESCLGIARGDDIDVIEIDAASNTGVDNVRTIIENSAYRPARSRFKVYIIDEVHMLSKQAFNALLKTLEEPPEHVKFILATTEAEKVLQTILSRCQRYDFRNIPTREIAGHLKEITKKEGIAAEEDALLLIAKAGAGSMRDALSLLDRLLSLGEKKLTAEMIEQLLGLPKAQLMFDLAQAIGEGDVKAVLRQSGDMINRGLSPDTFVASLVDHLRNLLILRTCGPESELVEVPGVPLKDLTTQAARFDPVQLTQDITILEELRRHMRQSQSGRALLDATLVRLTLAEQFTPVAELLARVGATPAPAGDGAQKKNRDSAPMTSPSPGTPGEGLSPSPPRATNLSFAPNTSPRVGEGGGEGLAVEEVVSQFRDPPVGCDSSHHLESPQIPTVESPSPTPAPVVTAPPSLDFEDSEDDDLPRPGKVWEQSGPSLKELLAQEHAKAQHPSPPDEQFNNIEPVAADPMTAAWAAILDQLKDAQGMFGVLSNAKLVKVEEDHAVVRFARSVATFTRSFEKNGKKDLLRDTLSKVLGRPVGVKFEIEENDPDTALATAPGKPVAAPVTRAIPAKPQAADAPAVPPGPPAIRITPELVEQMRKEPLVAALIDSLGATPVKIE